MPDATPTLWLLRHGETPWTILGRHTPRHGLGELARDGARTTRDPPLERDLPPRGRTMREEILSDASANLASPTS